MNKFAPPFIVKVIRDYDYERPLGTTQRRVGELPGYYVRVFAEDEINAAPAGHAELLVLQPSGEYANVA